MHIAFLAVVAETVGDDRKPEADNLKFMFPPRSDLQTFSCLIVV